MQKRIRAIGVSGLITAIIISVCNQLFAQSLNEEFSCYSIFNEQLFVIERLGNEKDRTSELAIFERSDIDCSLKLIRHLELVDAHLKRNGF
jgi:hypothetical protein